MAGLLIQAAVFDFDGLILDTETAEFDACRLMFEHFGARLPLSAWAVCIGTRGAFDPYAHLQEQAGPGIDLAAARELRLRLFRERMAGKTARPGVTDYLADARRLGLRIGLASSSDRSWVVEHLERLGLLPHFECIRTADDVERVKPEPDLYLRVLEHFGVPGERAVAFEDSPNGAAAAVRAGMPCVVVPNRLTARLPFPDGIRLRLASMADMPLPAVLRRLESGAAAPSPG